MSSLKVLHISTADMEGGAARAAYRLHQAGKDVGYSSQMFVQRRFGTDPAIVAFTYPMDVRSRVKRSCLRKKLARDFGRYDTTPLKDFDLFSDDRTEFRTDLVAQMPLCDVVNLHWISWFVDYRSFFAAMVERGIPVVWTLHDMNPFTGGCHYDRDCGRFTECCGECPQLKSHAEQDLSRKIWLRKQAALTQMSSGNLHIVAPSQWMAEEARRSALLKNFPISVIPYGLNTDDFTPRDRRLSREILNIPQDRKVLLFVAGGIHDVRKGISFAIDALSEIDRAENLLLVSIGKSKLELKTQIPYKHLGSIKDDRFLSLAYSAADLFVIPSVQDNLPCTVLESLSCGTPVAGFHVGGLPDMVRHGKTGILVPPRDVAALRAAILSTLHDPAKLKEMAANCRRIALEEYDRDIQARRYKELYEMLC